MSLKSELEEILRSMKTAVGAYIMDADGLVVEKADPGTVDDLEATFIEFMQGFRNFTGSGAEENHGPLREMFLVTDNLRVFIERFDGGYFLILALGAEGSFGEARYRLRRAAQTLAAEISG